MTKFKEAGVYTAGSTIPKPLFTIGPEDGEHGGTVVAVIARIDRQIPFAILELTETGRWRVLLNRGWTFVEGLAPLCGRVYDDWADALPELEAAYDGPWQK